MIFVGVLLLLRLLLLLLFLLLFLLPALAEDNRCEAAINSNSSRWVIATSPGAIDQLPKLRATVRVEDSGTESEANGSRMEVSRACSVLSRKFCFIAKRGSGSAAAAATGGRAERGEDR